MSESAASDRRGFLRSLAGEMLRGRGRLVEAMAPEPADPAAAETLDAPAIEEPLALPSLRLVSSDELAALAIEAGLERRLSAVSALARRSIRLTAGGAGRSRRGAPGDACVLELDLADVAEVAGGGLGLPQAGVLRCVHAGGHLVDVVVHEQNEDPGDGPAVALSAELTLPRVWAAPVQALGLDPAEEKAWEALRERLAELQGVELPTRTPQRLDRVLGWPEDRIGDMPLSCELVSRGHDLGGEPAGLHPHATECEGAAARWRLAVQLVLQPDGRLFVWVPSEGLAEGDLSAALAVIR